MGRVKSLMIKKAARQLYEQVGDFNEDFDHNKRLLKGTMPYKSVRNKVAGEIVRLARKQKQKELKVNKENREDDRGDAEE